MRHRMSWRLRSTAWSASLLAPISSTSQLSSPPHVPRRIHQRRQIRHARPKLALVVLLPPDDARPRVDREPVLELELRDARAGLVVGRVAVGD